MIGLRSPTVNRVVGETTYTVTAKRWEHGWELHVPDVGVTQSHTLAAAEREARDYISIVNDIDDDAFRVEVVRAR